MKTPKQNSILRHILLFLLIILLSFYISTQWVQLMLIQGDSMLPSYHNFQIVLLQKQLPELKAGDVVAFRCEALSAVLVKRIAACPGDTVQIRDGILTVNGAVSPVYSESTFAYAGLLEASITLEEEEYILLGDNIAQSKDSRYPQIGIVRFPDILGKVL